VSARPNAALRWLGIAVLGCGAFGAWRLYDARTRKVSVSPVETVEVAPEPAASQRVALPDPNAAPDPRGTTDTAPADVDKLTTGAAGDEWTLLNNAAVKQLEAGETEAAIEKLERCIAADPQREAFRANLAEALARFARFLHDEKLDLAAAIERLARAVELAPARADLAELLERWRKEHTDHLAFWHDQSAHFDLSYAGERADLLNGGPRLIDELESAYDDFRERFGVDFAGNGCPLVQVVLYRRDVYRERTGLGDWSSGAFDGVVRLPVEQLASELDALRNVLRHELAHAFVKAAGGGKVPGWLNEGVAQWREGRSASELEWMRRTVRAQPRIPVAELRGTLAAWEDKSTIGRAYQQSLALVLALQRELGERFVYELIAACGRGEDPEALCLRSSGRHLDELEF
jgi:Tfp pilus assembly protein PilF